MTVDRPQEGYRLPHQPGTCLRCGGTVFRPISETIERCVECERHDRYVVRVRKDSR